MRINLKRTLALLLAVIMTVCMIPFTALSADDSDAVTLLAADMAVSLSGDGQNFYGNRALDTEAGIYNFTGIKGWTVNETNSLITVATGFPAANKYLVLGVSVNFAQPSTSNNIKVTVDGTATYLSADFSDSANAVKYIIVDASTAADSGSIIDSVGIMPFVDGSSTTGRTYNAGIEQISAFTTMTEAEAYVASKTSTGGTYIEILAEDMEVTLSGNGKNFYLNRALDTDTGVYNFTGPKAWTVNEDNSLITVTTNMPAANKYLVLGVSVSYANPSTTGNVKVTVDGTATYLSADFTNTADAISYILVDASSAVADGAANIDSVGIMPLLVGSNTNGKPYNAGIELIAGFTSLEDANAYLAEKNPTAAPATEILAKDMTPIFAGNASGFYGNRALDSENGVYNFTGTKTDWTVNEDNSLITIPTSLAATNKYIVLGICAAAAYPSSTDNIKVTVDGTASYLSADLTATAAGLRYVVIDASSLITSTSASIDSIGILPFTVNKNIGGAYNAAIERIAAFTTLEAAQAYADELNPVDNIIYAGSMQVSLSGNASSLYGDRAYDAATGLYTFTGTKTSWTINEDNSLISIATEKSAENKYIVLALSVSAKYPSFENNVKVTVDGTAKYLSADFTSTSDGITYIVLDASSVIADGASTIGSVGILPFVIGYNANDNYKATIASIGFYKTKAEALEGAMAAMLEAPMADRVTFDMAYLKQNKTVTAPVSDNLAKYNTEALVDAAVTNGASYIEFETPSDTVILSDEFIVYLTDEAPDVGVNVITPDAKVTISSDIIAELSTLECHVVLSIIKGTNGVTVTLADTAGEVIEPLAEGRVLLLEATGDTTAVATVDGDKVLASGNVVGSPAVNTTFPATVSYVKNEYTDFADTNKHWARENVRFVTARDLFNGVSAIEFIPNGNMTRAMAAAVLNRLSGENITSSTNTYVDVPANAWYAKNIEWAYVNGVAEADITEFRPDEPITREELALFIYNFAISEGENVNADTADFTDYENISFTDAVDYCAANGIITGYPDGSFKPGAFATRAEVAAMISRYIKSTLAVNDIDIMDYQDVEFDEDNIVLTFVAASDIHIDSSSKNGAAVNYENAMNVAYDLATNGDIDLVFAAGDLIQNLAYDPSADADGDGDIDRDDHTRLYEIDAFKTHTDSFLRGDTSLVFATGNHDRSSNLCYEDLFYAAFTETAADKERYYRYDIVEDCDYEKGNRHAVVEGYHFLSVGMHQDYKTYLKPILDELTANDPYRPVFVQYHYHAADTVYSTRVDASSTDQKALKELLDNYPQVVFFSGHTHNGLENPRAIWQGTFTALDTASVRYLDDNSLIYYAKRIPVNATHGEVFTYATEATLVEVDANNNIRFRAYNGYRGDVVNEFVIAAPNADNTHLLTYTDEREAYSTAPEFDKNAKFTLTKLTDNHIGVYFDQATHDDIVWYYSIKFEAEGESAQTFYFTSRYYDGNGMPDAIDCTLYTDAYYVATNDNHAGRGHKLTEGVTYTATLTAYDVWDHPSETITVEYTA